MSDGAEVRTFRTADRALRLFEVFCRDRQPHPRQVSLAGLRGRLLLGGRAAAIHGAMSYDLDVWRHDIYHATLPHLEVEVAELVVPEGPLPGFRRSIGKRHLLDHGSWSARGSA